MSLFEAIGDLVQVDGLVGGIGSCKRTLSSFAPQVHHSPGKRASVDSWLSGTVVHAV